MGGPEEGERNAAIAAGLESCEPSLQWADTGTGNSLLEFAALVDGLDLLDRVPDSDLVEAVHAGLPQGSEVTAVYRDEKDPRSGTVPVQVCVRIASVAFLHELRDAVLMGRLEERMKQRLKLTVVVDKSSFANAYEASVLKLDKLTPHQEERLAQCRGERDVHLKAPAGGGKTYIALHRILEKLMAGNQKALVLFVAKNQALSHLICTWICQRLKDNPMQRLAVLSRLFLLFDPMEDGPREVSLREGRLTFAAASSHRFTMVVVDEAHHVYSDPRLRTEVERYIRRSRLPIWPRATSRHFWRL